MKRLVVPAALALVLTPLLTGIAQAASTCIWDSGTATLTVTWDGSGAETLSVSGTAIIYDGATCDPAATTATVDDIVITAGVPGAIVLVDLGGGAFGPGAETEATGTAEIEFTVTGVEELIVEGGSGDDVFAFGVNGVNLNDDDDVDLTFSGAAFFTLRGMGGADTMSAAGDSVVGAGSSLGLLASGGLGNDSITGGPGFDILDGLQGEDDLRGGDSRDVLNGDADSDTLSGGPGNDDLSGGDAADTLNGGLGNDELIGGDGSDTVTYEDSPAGVALLNLPAHGAEIEDGSFDQVFGIENAIGSPFADAFLGDGRANEFFGGAGNDEIRGRGGPDVLAGQAGNRDQVGYEGAPSGVSVNLATGHADGWGSDTIQGVERAIGSSHNDDLIGSAVGNHLVGLGGSDLIRGGPGSDRLSGGGGADRIVPGPGADEASGGPQRDTIDLSTASRSVNINLSTGKTAGDGADVIAQFENARGSRFADRIIGNGKANLLWGWRGDDTLGGLGSADRLLGGVGQDTLSGGDGPDSLIGDAAHDVLRGGAGDDQLIGGEGPDLLHGDPGNDALNGGPGTDTCYQDAGSGPETSCEKPAPPPSGGGGGGGDGGGGNCSSSYPDFCIPPPPPDLDCDQVNGSNFTVVGSDPHGFDGDGDGVGCES